MIEAKIMELLSEKISGEWGEESMSEQDVNVIRTANFTNIGEIRFDNIVKRSIDKKIVIRKKLNDGDIIIEKSGGSPNQPVGRVVYFQNPNNEIYLCNNFTTILRPKGDIVLPKYFFYLLHNNYKIRKVLEFQNKTTGIINLKLDRYLESKITFEPNFDNQNKTIAILDKVKSLLDKREKAITLYDDLLKSTFMAMFGDPVVNPKGWPVDSLTNHGSLKNGLNFNKSEEGFQVKCLGVGDFKSLWKLKDTKALSFINLSGLPSKEYFLKNKDLVFVRSNGNKELVGRCIIVYPNDERITFSGFCIRYRVDSSQINPIYLTHLFRNPAFKKTMLQNGRGANIQNISQQSLESLKIPVPDLRTQNDFAIKVDRIEGILTRLEKINKQCKELSDSLYQQFFSRMPSANIDEELNNVINATSFELNEVDDNINTVKNSLALLQRLIDRLKEQDFEDKDQYEKAKYIIFQIMKEEENLITQVFTDSKIKLTLQNEAT